MCHIFGYVGCSQNSIEVRAARPVGRHDGTDGEGGIRHVSRVPRFGGSAYSGFVILGHGASDPQPEIREEGEVHKCSYPVRRASHYCVLTRQIEIETCNGLFVDAQLAMDGVYLCIEAPNSSVILL